MNEHLAKAISYYNLLERGNLLDADRTIATIHALALISIAEMIQQHTPPLSNEGRKSYAYELLKQVGYQIESVSENVIVLRKKE